MSYSLKDFTSNEKIKLVIGKDNWLLNDLDGKVNPPKLSDGPLGLRCIKNTASWGGEVSTIPSTAYPSFSIISQTWDLDLAYQFGKHIANDAIEVEADVILGPGINIKRTPLNGRNFEYLSEDPLIAGTFAREYIKGVQDEKIGTSLKHFCCNNLEYSRNWISSEVDERTLREIYLKPFQIACEAKPWTVMCSYNLVNGVRMSENKKLYDILRKEFEFDGMIVSDWEASKDAVKTINAGLDLIMPFVEERYKELENGLLDNTLNLDALNASAQNILNLINKNIEARKERKIHYSKQERREMSKKLAQEGIVLLKNENNALPLKEQNIFVTGANSFNYACGGGSSRVLSDKEYVSLEKALNNVGKNATFFESTWDYEGGNSANTGNIKGSLPFALKNEVTVFVCGTNEKVESEGFDRTNIKLAKGDIDAIKILSKYSKKFILVVASGSVMDLSEVVDCVDAILYIGYPGDEGMEALASILIGETNPSGRLTETWPLKLEDTPSYHSYFDPSVNVYSEGLLVGYRYYETLKKEVLFSFGSGMSYSKIVYHDFNITVNGTDIEVKMSLTNESDFEAKEVVQIYVGEITKTVHRPIKELKAFQKVSLNPHEVKEVTINLDQKALEFYSVALDKRTFNKGFYEVFIGKNCHESYYSKVIEIK